MNPVGLPALTPNAKRTCEMHFQLKEMIKLTGHWSPAYKLQNFRAPEVLKSSILDQF